VEGDFRDLTPGMREEEREEMIDGRISKSSHCSITQKQISIRTNRVFSHSRTTIKRRKIENTQMDRDGREDKDIFHNELP